MLLERLPGFAESTCPGGDGAAINSGRPCSASVSGCDHGTHVAGIAAGHNGSLSGVAQDATLIAIKVFSIIHSADFCYPGPNPCLGAYDSDILAGLDRVYALRTQFDIAAVNLSLADGEYSGTCDASFPAYKSAIDSLRNVGIATVISSGNDGAKTRISAPACVSSAISVGATTKSDKIASYSNRSSALKLLAPGSSIYSSVPGGGYATFSGTSMAAPHVAGAWAVMRSRQPTASVTDILNALTTTGLGIIDPATGVTRRRIKLDAAVKSVPAGAPLITSLTADPAPPQPANAPITWTARAVGGTASFEYKFWLYNGQTASWTVLQDYSTSRSGDMDTAGDWGLQPAGLGPNRRLECELSDVESVELVLDRQRAGLGDQLHCRSIVPALPRRGNDVDSRRAGRERPARIQVLAA